MKEIIEKYRKWHGETNYDWKIAVIEKCKKDNVMHINTNQDLDWIYDDCLDYLFYKTTRRITNLAKKLGYNEPPCHHCRMIIKHWKDNDEYLWTPDKAHLFKNPS